ncbi:PVC-type heme-binding CxxCH protein [Blastopirellula marina]|uniref:Cytochrome c domain-containing protein n=1 Tax=Blastopirellula marina TaxID=124 RepID=A0A2S8G256_9BACT|nr:PVC-type heme-binding CxxCH protein [Blastopirellula marina]PQO38390.1 hypothetical protein C5Y98_10020 [Blastopirellula marina]PTL45047.1 hypothetical protein C5Y97_10030 [Blastopirellula marina]
MRSHSWIAMAVFVFLASFAATGVAAEFTPVALKVPEGYHVELAAAPPLVDYPIMANLDDQGRLYVAANSGENLSREDLEKQLPGFIQRLEDTDGDGQYDKSTVFVDQLTFPQGCLWHAGSLYVASSGALWKFTDNDDDGVADQREKLVGDFGYTGNAADIHGPFLGPDGRIYWCDGRHGHEIADKSGTLISKGKAARIFSCRTDGSDVQTFCTGGMDNPVEIVFTPEGEILGTVNLFYGGPRGDCLVHWQYGGVYPRKDYSQILEQEFTRTGDLLSEVVNFGHVAVSGLCRYEGDQWGSDNRGSIFITQFNTGRIVRVKLGDAKDTYAAEEIEDFLVAENHDFHPTDILQDKDGSLLVIDTGGWFRIGCPQSEIAKPDVRGAIYRIRRQPTSDSPETSPTAQATQIAAAQSHIWKLRRQESPESLEELIRYLGNEDPVVRQTAIRALLDWPNLDTNPALMTDLGHRVTSGTPAERRVAAWVLARWKGIAANEIPAVLNALTNDDISLEERHAIVLSLIMSGQREELNKALLAQDERVSNAAAIALEQLRRPTVAISDRHWLDIPAASQGKKLADSEKEQLLKLQADLPQGNPSHGQKLFSDARTACNKCHQVKGNGGQVGPDLTTIGRSRSRLDLLESILFPSATFARGFAPYTVLTDDGKVVSGIILGEGTDQIRLGIDKDQAVTLTSSQIEEIRASDISIMPKDLAKNLSNEELADLLAYLESLAAAR